LLLFLGVSLLVVALAPLLVCVGGIAGMGDMRGMMSHSDMMMGGRPMITAGIVLLAIIAGGISSLLVRPTPDLVVAAMRQA